MSTFQNTMQLWIVISGLTLFTNCVDFKLESENLTATTQNLQSSPNCASCHPYLLQDQDHLFHVEVAGQGRTLVGPVTCLDCHASSMSSIQSTVIDSVFLDTSGQRLSALDFPGIDSIRQLPLIEIDTIIQAHPIPIFPRPGLKPELKEWMTGLAHMNGKVDINFPQRISDTGRYHGQLANFSPTMETCSAIACHQNDKPYRFLNPAKGLTFLNGE